MYNGYNKEQLKIIEQGVPEALIKYREKGGRRYSYVELPVVTDILNKLFGNLWSWHILESNIHDSGITDPKNGITKKYVQVRGLLHVPMQDPNNPDKFIWVDREANGVHGLLGGDMEIRGSAFKSASSDALKKAASSLGIARNVYMSDELLMYLDSLNAEEEQDIWTEQTKAEYQKEFDEMVAFAQSHPDLEYYKKIFCDETSNYTAYKEITPSNIRAFLAWIKENETRFNPKENTANIKPATNITSVPVGQPW